MYLHILISTADFTSSNLQINKWLTISQTRRLDLKNLELSLKAGTEADHVQSWCYTNSLLRYELTYQLIKAEIMTTIKALDHESKFLESFQHSNVVQHLSTDEHPMSGSTILVTELMDCNLRSYLSGLGEKSLTSHCQFSLSKDVASGLAYTSTADRSSTVTSVVIMSYRAGMSLFSCEVVCVLSEGRELGDSLISP